MELLAAEKIQFLTNQCLFLQQSVCLDRRQLHDEMEQIHSHEIHTAATSTHTLEQHD